MAFAKLNACAVKGIDGYLLNVEIDMVAGLPGIDIVGLADTAVKESKERLKAAIKNSNLTLPQKKIIINLAPANTKKNDVALDLPMCMAILTASGQIDESLVKDYMILGELSLDGEIRGASGILPAAITAREHGIKKMIVPEANALEASVVDGVEVYGAKTLIDAVRHLRGEWLIERTVFDLSLLPNSSMTYSEDYSDVHGQMAAKRALEVAAAGGHNCLMIGPPGSGKTMLAKRLPTILPPLSFEESLEVTKIYSISGNLNADTPLITKRPFRSPHHTVSSVALTGGGAVPKPGEVSLAHRGVLFLDEFPEFRKDAIDALRQPIEEGKLTVSRASGAVTFPGAVMLIASMNPCKCGYYGDPTRECTCTPGQIQKYLGKVSGPMLDRFDMHIEVASVKYDDLAEKVKSESSADILKRVKKARDIQLKRYEGLNIYCNAQLDAALTEKFCPLDNESKQLLKSAFESLGLSARAHGRILKLARTIADLAGRENIILNDVAEAIRYRSLDKKFWYGL